nr:hypothetical protein [Pandoravirus massiliensis]
MLQERGVFFGVRTRAVHRWGFPSGRSLGAVACAHALWRREPSDRMIAVCVWRPSCLSAQGREGRTGITERKDKRYANKDKTTRGTAHLWTRLAIFRNTQKTKVLGFEKYWHSKGRRWSNLFESCVYIVYPRYCRSCPCAVCACAVRRKKNPCGARAQGRETRGYAALGLLLVLGSCLARLPMPQHCGAFFFFCCEFLFRWRTQKGHRKMRPRAPRK